MRSPISARLGPAVVAIALLSLFGCRDKAHDSANLSATKVSADGNQPIHLLDLDNRPRDLWRPDHDAVTVVVFTRSDCPISNRYAPDICRLYEAFHPRGVDFYLVYVDPREQPETIRAHLKEYEYPCPALRDPEHTLVAATGAKVTPEAVVFDVNRKQTYRGRIDDLNDDLGTSRSTPTKHDLADAIEATLAGQLCVEPVTKAVGCYIEDLE